MDIDHRSVARIRSALVPVFLIGGLLTAGAVFARQEAPPRSRVLPAQSLADVATLELAGADAEALRKADQLSGKSGRPLRIAEPRSVSVTPSSHGTWIELPNGGRLWRLRVHAPGATDLNFGFTGYRLPDDATLHVWSESDGYFEGPYAERDNKAHGQLWTPLIPGDRAVIELYLPRDARFDAALELTRVGVGYRDAFGGLKTLPGDCNVDVVCSEGKEWRSEIQGVARYTVGGQFLCSGSLINDAKSSRRPFFLTAFHCGVDSSSDQTVVVYWNFHSPRCGLLSGGALGDNQTGSTFVAGDFLLDGALIELDDIPDSAHGAYYNGWDRSADTPQRAVGIHHPQGDEKAISFDNDPLRKCAPELPDHWMASWDLGTTEPGSSGSPIFDADKKQIVGFLTGGDASCQNPQGIDCYGPVAEFFDIPAVRKALGAKAKKPVSVDGLDSACDCSAPNAILGTAGDDVLKGTSADDIICGLEGNDRLEGKGGRDCLEGGPGDDNLKGAKADDALHGGEGNDTCNGGKGKDSAGGCEKKKKIP